MTAPVKTRGCSKDLMTMAWPVSPTTFSVYDKYADTEIALNGQAPVWKVPAQGRTETFHFAPEAEGSLQRKLIMLTQPSATPPTICKFARSLIAQWSTYAELLVSGPEKLIRKWRDLVTDVDTAKAGKTVLKFACDAEVGLWSSQHLALVRGLETHARSASIAQQGRRLRRERLVPVDVQAGLVKVLDVTAAQKHLSEPEAEGLTALALLYQHGIRPVQMLALRVEHLLFLTDASAKTVCLVSFHAAKQADGEEVEIERQLRPEWTPALMGLAQFAKQDGRRRLFASTTSQQLWSNLRSVCSRRGVSVKFTAGAMRHTAAQVLADAGHSRESIQRFLAHKRPAAATTYLRASRQQGDLINEALGASKLYASILSLAREDFVSVAEMLQAPSDQQIGAVVGDRLVAGIGLCRTKQSSCPYNPVTSCYGCHKHVPGLDRNAHIEAIGGMRAEVLLYAGDKDVSRNPAYRQLTHALSGAQQMLATVDRILSEPQ